ncbi:MAG: hypothetical protein AB1782_06875, partial [Cyanobacteriota bacterium]
MFKKSIFSLLLMSLLVLPGNAFADVIYSKSGNVYQGKIVSVSFDGTEIETNNGNVKVDKNDIERVSFGNEDLDNLEYDSLQNENNQDYNYYNYTASNTEGVKLQSGTAVKLQLLEKVTSKKNHDGDVVHLSVINDVIKDGKILIPKGSKAFGEVVESKKNGMLAKGGKLGLQIKYVVAADETVVPLRGYKSKKGGDYKAEMITLS